MLKVLHGTIFENQVWAELKKIPYGEIRTYKQIAIALGRPNASRAVANACKKNPFPIHIPCHRVIKSNGNLGGYSGPGGIEMKQKLLDYEKKTLNIRSFTYLCY